MSSTRQCPSCLTPVEYDENGDWYCPECDCEQDVNEERDGDGDHGDGPDE